ncbi:DnaJ domain-containing protein [Nibribacter ruber]|uniref:DnaJ domain-containing protein n=1 Tax=Nibribacter ruber TaxID=2698458 RepID=A0A6P1P066_9BACT|nr:DnaJ domain-containing protein [Nibribacter ruber]QHL88224.1 DnaJ domain-containing protein [Nibribacter ruber]
MTQNYYHILGLAPSASASEIKAAYKRLALKYHPDRNPLNDRAEEQFKRVNEAYQILSDPRRKATYDLKRQYEKNYHQSQAYSNPRYHYTRPPAGMQERHYHQRPQRHSHFSKKDRLIALGLIVLLVLLLATIKLSWDAFASQRAYQRGQQAETQKHWAEAEAFFTEVLDHDEDQEEARLKRARLRLHHLNDPQGAVTDVSWLLEESEAPSAELWQTRAQAFLQLKNYRQALQDLNHSIELKSSGTAAYFDRGVARLHLEEDLPLAVKDLSVFLENPSPGRSLADAWLYRSFAQFKLKRLDLAKNDVAKALELDPLNARAYYVQAQVLKARKDIPGAYKAFKRAADLGFSEAEMEADRLQ